MTGSSKIEWTEATWNPIVGCSIVSPGCTNCYAMRMAHRLAAMGVPHYQGLTKVVNGNIVWTGKLNIAPDHIVTEPLRRKKPTMYFVNSMGDLFHEDCPDEWIDRVFAVMALCPQHTFQVLTKRSARMRKYIDTWSPSDVFKRERQIIMHKPGLSYRAYEKGHPTGTVPWQWPLPNVWLGVSAERQKEADERIPDLRATPAAVRFVSAEPLIGPIDFTRIRLPGIVNPFDALVGATWSQPPSLGGARFFSGAPKQRGAPQLDWVIVGGESGPRARPMHPDWARSIRDQCTTAGVAFFFKQWGAWAWSDEGVTYTDAATSWGAARFPKGTKFEHHSCGRTSFRVGKKAAGRLLDGREWNEMPATAIQPARPQLEAASP